MDNQNFLYLSLGAYIGVSMRLEIVSIVGNFLRDQTIPIDIFDNFIGSFVIGFYNDRYKKRDFSSHLAISTGFCGCLTTFSSWIIGIIDLVNSEQWFNCIIHLFIGTTVAYSGFKLGQNAETEFKFPFHQKLIYLAFLKLIIFQVLFQRWSMIVTALLSPFGAILRCYLSKLNHKDFPFGTLMCNLFAVWIAEALLISKIHLDDDSNKIINSVLKGFCGSLSTVSTWIKEICTMQSIELRFSYYWISLFLSVYIGLVIFQNLS
ncbi:unnamed protein product (macronuclear) [Paramecium tetraurelia]|uniref:Fluoride ion transporter CrcB n=1 Tax=Paramecium tetraurelia TaxID=5888 RepID=A0CCJ9_PARTE|nr:uncharacterized protein GSPATT00037301001 [Paramecium tetraurelia]CAK68516.1 unnamed protein product [Paramecium tetraurelia]|eukprot:XP_001435913.1 hypothetical protein (macronuclear) [Paramecium tetraurelia strain d4-2]